MVCVTRIEITRREPFADGMKFGKTGPYEKLVGTAFLEVDPTDPRNAIIQDLDKVPTNGSGMVEFSTDIYILKPVNMAKGNGKIFFEVNNRGNKRVLQYFNDGVHSNRPSDVEHAGNGFLMRRGYTVVWCGWQYDVPDDEGIMRVNVPEALSEECVLSR